MFNLFKNKENTKEKNLSLISVASILIHSAKIDENFTDKEKDIIKSALIEMGAKVEEIDEIIEKSIEKEKDSNQILDFTKDVKSLSKEEKDFLFKNGEN